MRAKKQICRLITRIENLGNGDYRFTLSCGHTVVGPMTYYKGYPTGAKLCKTCLENNKSHAAVDYMSTPLPDGTSLKPGAHRTPDGFVPVLHGPDGPCLLNGCYESKYRAVSRALDVAYKVAETMVTVRA